MLLPPLLVVVSVIYLLINSSGSQNNGYRLGTPTPLLTPHPNGSCVKYPAMYQDVDYCDLLSIIS